MPRYEWCYAGDLELGGFTIMTDVIIVIARFAYRGKSMHRVDSISVWLCIADFANLPATCYCYKNNRHSNDHTGSPLYFLTFIDPDRTICL